MDPRYSQYRDITVGALLTRLAETLPDNEALVYSERGLRLTFAELESEARLVARLRRAWPEVAVMGDLPSAVGVVDAAEPNLERERLGRPVRR